MQHNLMFLVQVGFMTCFKGKIKKEIQCSLPSNCLAGKSLLEVADSSDLRCSRFIPNIVTPIIIKIYCMIIWIGIPP